jgi:hypothetical protein
MIKHIATTLGLTALAVAAVGTATSPAFASTVAPRSCQASNATAYLVWNNGNNINGYDCTGTYTGNWTGAVRFDAGGWSGYYWLNGRQTRFCNWNSRTLSGTVADETLGLLTPRC